VAQPWEVPSLLFLGAEFPNRNDTREDMRAQTEDQAVICATVAQRLQRNRARDRIESAAAVFFGHRKALNAHLSACRPQVARKDLIPIALDHPGVQRRA